MLHKNMLLGDGHIIHNWEVANAAARLALTVLPEDKGKLAWQVDTNIFWFLANAVGPVWIEAVGRVGATGATGATGNTGATGTNGTNGSSAIFKTYATSVERLADVTLVTANLGYLARQTDDGSVWILLAITPVWAAVSGLMVTKAATYALTLTLDTRTSQIFNLTLTGNITLDLSNGLDGQLVIVRLIQDATGSRLLTFGTSIRRSADLPTPVLSTLAASTDYLGFRYAAAPAKFDFVGFIKGF